MNRDYVVNPNPDFIHRKKIEEAIKNNDGYCITALKKTEDTKCICKEFQEQKSGWCKCGQYYKVLKLPKVYVCGSSQFDKEIKEVAQQLTLEGYDVMIPILKDYDLEEIYYAKIAEADIVYVVDCDGYIGETVRKEINWAAQLGKKILYYSEKGEKI